MTSWTNSSFLKSLSSLNSKNGFMLGTSYFNLSEVNLQCGILSDLQYWYLVLMMTS
jgi:hypothetical protein